MTIRPHNEDKIYLYKSRNISHLPLSECTISHHHFQAATTFHIPTISHHISKMHALKTYLLSALCLTSATAKYLVSYNASAGDDPSVLGLLNLNGWNRDPWPPGQSQNSSLYFKTATDPEGVPAAHIHKSAHFTRAEYHMLKDETVADTTYYIGYKVRFDAVDYQTFVWQWKNYDSATVDADNVPAVLTFRKDADGPDYHTM